MPLGHEMTSGSARAARVFRVTLEHLERRREGGGPSRRIVLVGVGPAEHVDVLHVLGDVVGIAVEELVLVDRAAGGALARGAVVGGVEDEGVVELIALLQVVDDAAHLSVGVLRERRIDLGQAREELLLVGAERIPRAHVVRWVRHVGRQRIERGELGALGQDALRDHARAGPRSGRPRSRRRTCPCTWRCSPSGLGGERGWRPG